MPREKDVRDYSFPRAAAASLPTPGRGADVLPPGRPTRPSRANPLTGTPASIAAENVVAQKNYVDCALDLVREQVTGALGFSATETPEFVPDPHVQHTSAGTTIVHLHQQYHGIPVFQMTRSVQFGPDRRVERVVGDNVSYQDPLDTVPALTAGDALRLAARYLAEQEDPPEIDAWGQTYGADPLQIPPDYVPRVITAFDRPNRPTVLDRGPFGREVDAALVFFYTGPRMQLCWKLAVALPDLREQYLLLVDAERPFADVTSVDDAVLLCQRTTCAAMANVYLHNPGAGSRELVELPLVADTYPLNGTGLALPHPFPAAWWVDHDRTVGNCALTVQAVTASSFVGRIDSDAVLFDPAEADGDEQQLLNAFFFCNYMHDFFYMLGFSEAEGNFQKINFTNGGAANDAVVARVHPNRIPKTATFTTPADGVAPTMNLGAVSLPDGTVRHTALDSDVVFHEYVHGVTTRLVGGRMTSLPLQEPQSKAMGEGWGDYFALTIQNHGKAVEKVVTGDWITGRPAGTRSAPYDEQYPNTYGHIGVAPFNAEHHIGEIWCATLMQMNRNLDSAIGAPRGHQLGWQVVVDGLKLTPANPSFLDGRDAILKALEDLGREGRISVEDFTAARRAAWRAFAHFGLGAMASSNGASLHGIVEDRTVPDSI